MKGYQDTISNECFDFGSVKPKWTLWNSQKMKKRKKREQKRSPSISVICMEMNGIFKDSFDLQSVTSLRNKEIQSPFAGIRKSIKKN